MDPSIENALENSMSGEPKVGAVMAAIAVFIFLILTMNTKPKVFDEKAQREIAKKVLSGAKPEEIAQKEGCTVEDINKWKDAYVKMSVQYSFDAEKRGIVDAQKDAELRWFEDVMRKNLGDNWKEKTGYYERDLLRYKVDPEPDKKK